MGICQLWTSIVGRFRVERIFKLLKSSGIKVSKIRFVAPDVTVVTLTRGGRILFLLGSYFDTARMESVGGR